MSSLSLGSAGMKGSPAVQSLAPGQPPQGAQRPSAKRPREGFLQTPQPDVVVPLPPASPKPTKPVPIESIPDWKMPDFLDVLQKDYLGPDFFKNLKPSAKKASSRNLVGAAFWVGWEIGDYLFPNGWYGFGSGEPQFAGYSFPSNWVKLCDSGESPTHWRSGSHAVTCEGTGQFEVCTDPGNIGTGSNCGTSATELNRFELEPDHAISSVNFTKVSGFSFKQEISPGTYETLAIYEVAVTYEKRFGDSGPQPERLTSSPAVPAPLGGPLLSEAPWSFPLEWPMAFPKAQPWKDAKPAEKSQPSKNDQVERVGLVPAMPLVPAPVTVVHPVPGPGQPGTPPSGPPTQVITVPPPGEGPPTWHTEPNNPNNRKPPGKKTKEKKLNVRSKFGTAWAVLNLATEAFDFIDAMYKGLPEWMQDKTDDPYEKLQKLWHGFEFVDWDVATTAFINNQIEDMVFGMIGMVGNKANQVSGAATGGGGAVQKRPGDLAAEAQEAHRKDAKDEAIRDAETDEEKAAAKAANAYADKLPIPELSYNEETGRWELTVPLSEAGIGEDLTFT